jgi:hypothetical protein
MKLPTAELVVRVDDDYTFRYWYDDARTAFVTVTATDQRIAEARGMQDAITSLQPPELGFARVQAKFLEVDYGTDTLIENGFEYPPESGIMHSLTMEAQARLNALFTLYNSHVLMQLAMGLKVLAPQLTPLQSALPMRYNSMDDTHRIELADADDVKNFCMTAFGTMSAILNSGTEVKNALREFGHDEEIVISFRDPRFEPPAP